MLLVLNRFFFPVILVFHLMLFKNYNYGSMPNLLQSQEVLDCMGEVQIKVV